MKIHTWEKAFLAAGLVVLFACGGALVYATFAMDIHLPGDEGRIDPRAVRATAPFDEPGVHRRDDGGWEVVVIASAWSFQPEEVRVPAGVEILFTSTTTDVIHGFHVEGTRLNMMLIPGQVSRNRYTFEGPGEYLLICHEFCGAGHHLMAGRIVVVDESELGGDATTEAEADAGTDGEASVPPGGDTDGEASVPPGGDTDGEAQGGAD